VACLMCFALFGALTLLVVHLRKTSS